MMGLVPRTTQRLSREEKKAQTRNKLLDAAATVFARKGFAGASLDDVAEEAGLTKGAVYSNFASKDDLIEALLDERLDAPQLNIASSVDQDASPAEQGRQAAAMFMSLVERERDTHLLGLEFMAHLARNPHLATRRGSYHKRIEWFAADIEARAKEQGRTLPMPAYDLAIGLFALGQGIVIERLLNPDVVPEDLFGRMLNLIMRLDETPQGSGAAPAGKAGKAKR
jgi:AcrR family transcriptional regulator